MPQHTVDRQNIQTLRKKLGWDPRPQNVTSDSAFHSTTNKVSHTFLFPHFSTTATAWSFCWVMSEARNFQRIYISISFNIYPLGKIWWVTCWFERLVDGWTNPSEKNMLVKLDHSPNFRDEHKTDVFKKTNIQKNLPSNQGTSHHLFPHVTVTSGALTGTNNSEFCPSYNALQSST